MQIKSVIVKLDHGDDLELEVCNMEKNKKTFFTYLHTCGKDVKIKKGYPDNFSEYYLNKKPKITLQQMQDFRQVVFSLDINKFQEYKNKLFIKYVDNTLIEMLDFFDLIFITSDGIYDDTFKIKEYNAGTDNPNVSIWRNEGTDIVFLWAE